MMSLARGLAVIRAFDEQRRPQTIAQISQTSGIPRAAVRRCLHTLVTLGYVGSDGERGFYLRPTILTLGYAYVSSTPIAAQAQPLLDRVGATVNKSCSVAVLEGDRVVYIARSHTSRRIMSVDVGVGSHLPAYCTSLGRVLLSGLSPAELDAYLSRVEIRPLTPHTLKTAEELRRAIAVAAAQQYATIDQELELGLRSIAVPVKDRTGKSSPRSTSVRSLPACRSPT